MNAALERVAASYWNSCLTAILVVALFLRWPFPEPTWTHVDEWVLVVFPLGFWSGDLNPHFFNYPTFHLYFLSAVYYLYYLMAGESTATHFLTYHYFIDDGDLVAIARGVGSIVSVGTVAICALLGRRLYGSLGGLVTGLFAAVMLLPVRFAHLAITDNPAVLWIAMALLWAVRMVQERGRWDGAVAGIFVGLAAATKFPSALIAVPVVLAALLIKPTLRQRHLWIAAVSALATTLLATPYVFLDWSTAWSFLTAMGKFHIFANEASPDEASLLYHVRHNLRYGLGAGGLVFAAGGILWRFRQMRPEEVVVLSGAVPFLILLASAESVFMRYLLPLVPMLALFAVRFLSLIRAPRPVLGLALLGLLAEPAYASLRTRSLLSTEDTRERAISWIKENAPGASYLVNIPASFGNLQVPEPGRVYVRQKHFIKSFDVEELMDAFASLSVRSNLGPMFLALNTEAAQKDLVVDWKSAEGSVLVLDYKHPILPPPPAELRERVLQSSRWLAAFSPGRTWNTPFDVVDWHFLPLGDFRNSNSTGPEIRIGELPFGRKVGTIYQNHFFAVIHGILKANIAMQKGEWERAIQIYDSVSELSVPLDEALTMDYLYDYYFNLGLAHHHLGRFDKAVSYWEENVQLQPQTAKPYNNLAAAHFRLGDLSRAAEVWEQAIELEPDYPEAYFNLGNALFTQQKYDRAAEAWKRAIQLKPDYGQAHYGLGNISYQLGDLDRALAAYKTALQFSPDEANIHYNMAQVHLRHGHVGSAIESFERVVDLLPDDAETLLELGKFYANSGRTKDAKKSFERVLTVVPNHPQAEEIRSALGAL
jgi:tetratricopeptide (TPR) repeat protein